MNTQQIDSTYEAKEAACARIKQVVSDCVKEFKLNDEQEELFRTMLTEQVRYWK